MLASSSNNSTRRGEYIIMNFLLTIINAIMLAMCSPLLCAEGSSFDEELVHKYSVSSEIAAILDNHASVFIDDINKALKAQASNEHFERLIWEFDELPQFIIKYRADRIKGMVLLSECIKKIG